MNHSNAEGEEGLTLAQAGVGGTPARAGAAGRWNVKVSAPGDLLVVEDALGDVGVVVFLNGRHQSREPVQARLHDLLEEGLRSSHGIARHRRIPTLLQSVVKCLLDWSDELHAGAGGPVASALVVLHSLDAPAVAHIGGEEPRLSAAGAILAPQGFTLRGPHGGEARALCLTGRDRRVHLTWSTGKQGTDGSEGRARAEWSDGTLGEAHGTSARQLPLVDHLSRLASATPARGAERESPRGANLAWSSEASGLASLLKRPMVAWLALGLTVGLLWLGWTLGDPHRPGTPSVSPLAGATALLGLTKPRYECLVQSNPGGAAISVDGKATGRTTPATLSLAAGEHTITLETPKWGARALQARGQAGDHVTVDAALWGSIDVQRPTNRAPVSVWVDDVPRGSVPVTIDSLAPGPHMVTFSLPGTAPWGRSVEVRVNQVSEIVAQTRSAPTTGDVEVSAMMQDDTEGKEVTGASVWVDGKLRGSTPLSLSLSSGPHSFRASYHGEESAVMLINLPGGNKRFVQFRIGSEIDQPRLALLPQEAASPVANLATVAAQLEGIDQNALREMWLYACAQDRLWRRYPMAPLPAAGGVVGVALLPMDLLSAHSPFYVSASAATGDEYFTEIQDSQELRASARSSPR